MNKFMGKTAVITGGGSGVGKAAAALFLAEGANVVIAGRDTAKLAAAAKDLGGSTHAIPCDVAEARQCQALIAEATRRFGRVDILVNNAGWNLKQRSLRDLTPEAWDEMIRINLSGAFYCTHAVLPQMIERRDGVIVNVVSVAGKRAYPPSGAAYAAAKHGLGALGMFLSNEERESGIRVSNIYPGEIDTPILDQRPTQLSKEQKALILKAEDVANAILFVAGLPPHVSVPELIIKPTRHPFI